MFFSVIRGTPPYDKGLYYLHPEGNEVPFDDTSYSDTLSELNINLKGYLEKNDFLNSQIVVDSILKRINKEKITDSTILSSSYYLIGIHYLFEYHYREAVFFMERSKEIKERKKEFDQTYAKTLYNLGLAYYDLGDFVRQENCSLRSLEIDIDLYGQSSPQLIKTYTSLIIGYIAMQEYEKANALSKYVLKIVGNNPGAVDISDVFTLYQNLGVLYIHLADYSRAKVYFEKAESICLKNHLDLKDDYFGLMSNMAIIYGALGYSEKSNEYYEKGKAYAINHNSTLAYNYINNYALVLANNGEKMKGDLLMKNATLRAKSKFGKDSPEYLDILSNYASYLREYKIDNKKALEYYRLCIDKLDENIRNTSVSEPLYLGYALSLAEGGEPSKALSIIQALLFTDSIKIGEERDFYSNLINPDMKTLKIDMKSLNLLKSKYQIIWQIYSKTPDQKILVAASSTARLIVEVLEKVRINISEEDSRLILGDRYRDSYLSAIRDFYLLYNQTSDPQYLDAAFEFSEKSKVAGLLTSTRELKAAQFNIPSDIAEFERKLQRDISLLSAKVSEELKNEKADTFLINKWKESILRSSLLRDSLITVFEKEYPGYYAFKYNTQVVKPEDISGIIGRDRNYLNYVSSDTVLYIFISNRKHTQILALPIDSSLYSDIAHFRTLLSMPSPSANARDAFENYQQTGYRLYQKIVEPVRPYLISKILVISPDNILSYIPFETIPTSPVSGNRILYSQIPYLMNEFDISYTYSATFMAESANSSLHFGNKLIAFAPSYNEPIDISSVLMNRQMVDGKLSDLPFARLEAEYVSKVTGGKLYENDDAKETVYKSESGKYDIIHLAMHTILNDKDPMYSTLIFSSENDTTGDRYLKTYEVYSIPLRAKMVVLSSCNSGAGYLYSGEGILSLARGFMYSGSESVVMAMWEIEDKSGTEIVKNFYDNLKKGYSKSYALKRARVDYLENADQLRAHPYFWSALVIYGNDSPLYYSNFVYIVSAISIILFMVSLFVYFWRRRYS